MINFQLIKNTIFIYDLSEDFYDMINIYYIGLGI